MPWCKTSYQVLGIFSTEMVQPRLYYKQFWHLSKKYLHVLKYLCDALTAKQLKCCTMFAISRLISCHTWLPYPCAGSSFSSVAVEGGPVALPCDTRPPDTSRWASRGFSGVHNIFVKPEIRLNPSPVNTKNSESRIKTKIISSEHNIFRSETQIRL